MRVLMPMCVVRNVPAVGNCFRQTCCITSTASTAAAASFNPADQCTHLCACLWGQRRTPHFWMRFAPKGLAVLLLTPGSLHVHMPSAPHPWPPAACYAPHLLHHSTIDLLT